MPSIRLTTEQNPLDALDVNLSTYRSVLNQITWPIISWPPCWSGIQYMKSPPKFGKQSFRKIDSGKFESGTSILANKKKLVGENRFWRIAKDHGSWSLAMVMAWLGKRFPPHHTKILPEGSAKNRIVFFLRILLFHLLLFRARNKKGRVARYASTVPNLATWATWKSMSWNHWSVQDILRHHIDDLGCGPLRLAKTHIAYG